MMSIIENPSPDFQRQFIVAINARKKLKGVSYINPSIVIIENISKFRINQNLF
jgi:hypothetical protein